MRTIFSIFTILASWVLTGVTDSGVVLPGVKSLWAVKAPTAKERQESVSNPDQHKKKEWFGREVGKNCECGASKVDRNKCYYPKQGQLCCSPKTGDCHVVKTTKWNIPFKD